MLSPRYILLMGLKKKWRERPGGRAGGWTGRFTNDAAAVLCFFSPIFGDISYWYSSKFLSRSRRHETFVEMNRAHGGGK